MQQRKCTKCGRNIVEGALFCAFCGLKLTEPEAPSPVKFFKASSPVNAFKPVKDSPDDEVKVSDENEAPAFYDYDDDRNPDGTVRLVGPSVIPPTGKTVKKGEMTLTSREMEKGVAKIIDFGTGKRFEIIFPAGLHEGDTIVVTDTGLKDEKTGAECEIRLRIHSTRLHRR